MSSKQSCAGCRQNIAKSWGWAMSFSLDSKLTVKALEMAWEARGKPVEVMFYSDQGSHYTSR